LNPDEQIKYKLVNMQPDDAVIVNTHQPNLPIDIGFAARQKSREHHSEKTN